MSILSVSVGISLYAEKGGGLSEPTPLVSSEFTAPDKMRNKRRPRTCGANFILSEQAFSLGLLCLLFISGCAAQNLPYQETRVMMGTYATIKIADADKSPAQKKETADKAFREIKRLEDILSSFKSDSAVAKINNSGGAEVLLDDDTYFILDRAKYFYEISGGAFDVTVKPLMELWGFHGGSRVVPPDEKISAALAVVGSDKVILNAGKKSARLLAPGVKIDLGGIAAGYIVDRAIAVLKEAGIKHALVDAGGDIRAIGRKNKNEKWSIGIRDPVRKNRIIRKVYLEDEAITTSGGYEKFFEANGKRYSHLMDPKTGRPLENSLLSVTVIARDCLSADALATAIMILGKEKGKKLENSLKDIKMIIISSEDFSVSVRSK